MAGPTLITAIADLDAAIRAAVPSGNFLGVSVGDPADKTTWRLAFAEAATQVERDAAQVVFDVFTVEQMQGPSRREQRRAQIEADPAVADMVDKLRNASMAQIDNWLTNNVTNLAQARQALGIILKILATRS